MKNKGDGISISCATVLSYCRQNDTIYSSVIDYSQCLSNCMLILSWRVLCEKRVSILGDVK